MAKEAVAMAYGAVEKPAGALSRESVTAVKAHMRGFAAAGYEV